MKKTVALIFGSMDSEHDVSIESAASVYEHFPHDKYQCLNVYISREGSFYTGDFDFDAKKMNDAIALDLRFDKQQPGFICRDTQEKISVDAAFLMLHGKTGEGGSVQGLLEMAHIPYTGSNLLSSALCMDKIYTHEVCEANGIPMAQYQYVSSHQEVREESLSFPCIVKPSREGSSFGVSYVENREDLKPALDEAFKFDERVLIEEYIKGVEVGVAIYDTKQGRIVSEPDQVNVSGDVFDFQEKYHPHRSETLPYAQFPQDVLDQIKAYANEIFDLLSCRHIGRLDFFVTEDHAILFNEVNTIPGFTQNSRYPQMIARKGLSFKELITGLIEDVL